MKHTPGPWVFERQIAEVRTSYADPTSEYGNGTPIVRIEEPHLESGQANGHLISAAPDMLAVLESVQSKITDPDLSVAINYVIAKAKGEL